MEGLITKDVSRRILNAITSRHVDCDVLEIAESLGLVREVEVLQKNYEDELRRLPQDQIAFRNFPFYRMIERVMPEFEWSYRDVDAPSERVLINGPRVAGRRVPLLSLLLEQEKVRSNVDKDPFAEAFENTPFTRVQVDRIREVLSSGIFRAPSRAALRTLALRFSQAAAGNRLTLFSPVCPDYSYEPLPNGRFQYTFESLGDGIGLVARRLMENLPVMVDLVGSLGLDCDVVIGAGDFEGYDQSNVARLGVDQNQFVERVRRSCERIVAGMPIPVEHRLIGEMVGGQADWESAMQEAIARLEKKSSDGDEREYMLAAIRARKRLYTQWYGVRDRDADFLPLLIRQAAEYALIGKCVGETFECPVVIGFDHHVMSHFYSEYRPVAAIYTDCIYD